MPLPFTVTFENVAYAAAQDAFYVKPAADHPVEIYGLEISPVVSSTADWGDANTEIDRIRIRYLPATVTVGSGGSAATARSTQLPGTSISGTYRINDTTAATSSGTAYDLHASGWNLAVGYSLWLPPGSGFVVLNADALTVNLPSTPANSKSISATLYGQLLV